jgi:hypothetical protein
MALELLGTKWAGVIPADPAPPDPASRAEGMAPDRSESAAVVMMLDAR